MKPPARNRRPSDRPVRQSVRALAITGLLVPMLAGGSVAGPGLLRRATAAPVSAASVTVVPVQPAPEGARGEAGGTPAAAVTAATPVSVPSLLWQAYADAVQGSPSGCHLPISLLAAIGQVESGSLAGRALDPGHRVVPAVLGPVLDGHGFAAVADTDRGVLDGSARWDRAVGPMQFIPGTWARWARDGDIDGTVNPQDIEDAAATAAAYLCAGGRDLATPEGLRAAILSYNHSTAYLALVLSWKRAFEAIPPETGPIDAVGATPAPAREPVRAATAASPPSVVWHPPAGRGPAPSPPTPASTPVQSAGSTGPSRTPSPTPSPAEPSTQPSTEPVATPASGPAADPPAHPSALPSTRPPKTPKPGSDPAPPASCPTPSAGPTTDPAPATADVSPVAPTTSTAELPEPADGSAATPSGSPDPCAAGGTTAPAATATPTPHPAPTPAPDHSS